MWLHPGAPRVLTVTRGAEPDGGTFRRDRRWLLMSLLGCLSGSGFGLLVVWLAALIVAIGGQTPTVSATRLVALSAVAGLFGAGIGLVSGMVVGLLLMALVPTGRAARAGRRRVFWVATIGHFVTLLVLLLARGFGLVGMGTLLLLLSPPVAGLVALWLHARLRDPHAARLGVGAGGSGRGPARHQVQK